MRPVSFAIPGVFALFAALPAMAQRPAVDSTRLLTVDRLFRRGEFAAQFAPPMQWMRDGSSFVTLREVPAGMEIVRVRLPQFDTTVLASASALIDERGRAIDVEELTLSADETKALLFHSSVRVWRSNTRGLYHVIDFATGRVTPLVPGAAPRPQPMMDDIPPGRLPNGAPGFLSGGLASGAIDPDLQMFAKFSPDARQVAFVRGNNLWVTELATGRATRLTADGSDDIINGTTDWVYEEEFGLADAFRWSPDSRRLAFWRFDQSAVPAFPMVDELRRYPEVSVLRYPKAGAPNARMRIGVIAATGGPVRLLEIGPDTGQYVPRMEWADNDSLALIRMPRKQNELSLLMMSATSGTGRTILTDRDSAYVDVEGEPVRWLGSTRFLLRSDRTGWRQWFLYDRRGTLIRQVTRDGVDVLDLAAIDETRGFVYATIAAPTPRDEQVMRYALDGRTAPVALTTAGGSHALDIAPGARYAQYVTSTLNTPPVTRVVSLPRLNTIRMEADNAVLSARLRSTALAPATFVRIPMPDGTLLDGYRIVPPNFDSTRAHPVLLHTYGGPAAPSVVDRWGGRNFLFHQALAQRGYIVLVVDPRGAAWRGRAFRKVTQFQLGIRESDDMIAVARWLGTQRWADRGRIGMWGWSYGGFMTAMTTARGGSLFKAGIVVAPVTDYRYYDTIYTERFMWTPDGNSDGYRKSSVMTHVGTLSARLLLVHGTGDDNVHPQNTLNLVDALVQANKPFDMLLYPNRTHSIAGGNTTPHLYESFLRFLMEQL